MKESHFLTQKSTWECLCQSFLILNKQKPLHWSKDPRMFSLWMNNYAQSCYLPYSNSDWVWVFSSSLMSLIFISSLFPLPHPSSSPSSSIFFSPSLNFSISSTLNTQPQPSLSAHCHLHIFISTSILILSTSCQSKTSIYVMKIRTVSIWRKRRDTRLKIDVISMSYIVSKWMSEFEREV